MNDIVAQKFNGTSVALEYRSVENIKSDLSLVKRRIRVICLTFVFLDTERTLIFGQAAPLLQQLHKSSDIAVATPPLTSFEFNMAWVKKGVNSTPAAQKLHHFY